MRFFSLRAIFLLGFIIAMPVLALPSVARRIDEWLYGAASTDFGRLPTPPPITQEPLRESAAVAVTPEPNHAPTNSIARSPIAPARFDEPSPAPQRSVQPVDTASFQPATPPPLPASPPFAAAEKASLPPEPRIDDRTIARLQQIRQRLEQLGAEYVIVDTQESGRFRFHCRMLVDPQTRYTRPFDATSFDPIAAGEQVLGDVERWRSAAATTPSGGAP